MTNFTENLFKYVYDQEVKKVCDYYSLLRRSLNHNTNKLEKESLYTSTELSISNVSTLSMACILDVLIEKIITVEDELFLTKLHAAANKTGNKVEAHGNITLHDVHTTAALLEKTNRRVDKYILPRGMIFDFIKSDFKEQVDPCCDRELLLMGHIGYLYGANLTTVSVKVKKDTAIMKDNNIYAVADAEELGLYAVSNSINYDSKQDILTINHKVHLVIEDAAVANLEKIAKEDTDD